MSYLLLAQVLLFGLSAQAATNDELQRTRRLVNGSAAIPGEAPFMVSLQINGSHKCGGAIISNNFIITAGHCADSLKAANSSGVLTGTNNLSKGGVNYPIEKFHVHPDFENIIGKSLEADIALIRLKEPIAFNTVTRPIYLDPEELPEGSSVFVTGWSGVFKDGSLNLTVPPLLQILEEKAISNKKCSDLRGLPDIPLGAGHLCALAKPGSGISFGDSGSPLTFEGGIVGIVSLGSNPTIYSRISYYHNWIVKTMRENNH